MSLKKRMVVFSGCIILFVLILSIFACVGVSRLNTDFKQLLSHEITTKIETIKVGREVNYVSRLTRNIMLGSNFDKDAKHLDETIDKIEVSFKKLADAATSDKERKLVEQAHVDAMAFVNDGRTRVLATKEMPAAERHTIFADYEKFATPLAMKSRESFSDIIKNADKNYDTNIKTFSQTITKTLQIIIILSSAAAIITLILFTILIRSVIGPIRQLNAQLHEIADGDGDLTRRLDEGRTDEFGQLSVFFNHFVSKLHSTFSQVAQQSSSITIATAKMHEVVVELSENTDQTASQTSTVAAASEEMSATSNDIAQSCYRAAESAQAAADTTQKGFEIVKHTVTGIIQRGEKSRDNARIVSTLGDRSNQIGEIVATIEDIADQTNLLALNAAIEAARAGEMGRGFAVVADEVRALAERTTKATKEISDMIKTIQNETRQAIIAMEEGVKGTEQGAAEAGTLETALQNILEQVNDVTMQISQIATAAEEQTATTGEITGNMHRVSQIIDETAKETQSISAIAESLNHTSIELHRLMKQFKY
ncbi:MAG: methyl-accepting chemotaxis protein [Geobacteraceae bacterium]|nr:methyl-accepting chemotaxis protein [Geobacteraceae bacterium]